MRPQGEATEARDVIVSHRDEVLVSHAGLALAGAVRSAVSAASGSTKPPWGSVKRGCVSLARPGWLEEALRLVAAYVGAHNLARLHGALGYITPADKLNSLETVIFAERDRKLAEARPRRQQDQARAAPGCRESERRIKSKMVWAEDGEPTPPVGCRLCGANVPPIRSRTATIRRGHQTLKLGRCGRRCRSGQPGNPASAHTAMAATIPAGP